MRTINGSFERASTLKPDEPKESVTDWRIVMQNSVPLISYMLTDNIE